MSDTELPDFDALWNFNDPAETERKFQEIFARLNQEINPDYSAELLTQIARTRGLQRKFEEAHQTLDTVEPRLANLKPRTKVRYLLERGRAFNSSKRVSEALPLFVKAWELAREAGEDGLAVDAAHMVAIAETGDAKLEWNEKALDLAAKSPDPTAQKWRGSLYNNLGWTYHDSGNYERSLELFNGALEFRNEQGDPDNIRIAEWCIARCLRSLNRVNEALAIQNRLVANIADKPDGYIQEELGELLLLQNKSDEARPHFAKAYEVLSKDAWLVDKEPERVDRLKALGTSEAPVS